MTNDYINFATNSGENLIANVYNPDNKAFLEENIAKMYEDRGIDLATFDKEAEIAKFKDLEPLGWNLYIRLYTEPQKKGSIIIPDKARDEGVYNNFVGLVVQLGKGCYTDIRYEHTGSWCAVGDWVIFPRHAGYRIFVGNIPLWVLKEDAIDIRIKNPDLIPILSKYRY